jgi:MFS superfamily sulfate permease-like transporter
MITFFYILFGVYLGITIAFIIFLVDTSERQSLWKHLANIGECIFWPVLTIMAIIRK